MIDYSKTMRSPIQLVGTRHSFPANGARRSRLLQTKCRCGLACGAQARSIAAIPPAFQQGPFWSRPPDPLPRTDWRRESIGLRPRAPALYTAPYPSPPETVRAGCPLLRRSRQHKRTLGTRSLPISLDEGLIRAPGNILQAEVAFTIFVRSSSHLAAPSPSGNYA